MAITRNFKGTEIKIPGGSGGGKVTLSVWEIWANVPDQDHIRDWVKIGECSNLYQYEKIRGEYIQRWEGTSNVMRLKEPGSFEVRLSKNA
jgi:hypothetical protein